MTLVLIDLAFRCLGTNGSEMLMCSRKETLKIVRIISVEIVMEATLLAERDRGG